MRRPRKGKPRPRGSDAARFLAKCRHENGHMIWTGGVQFRMGRALGARGTSPTQAAYCIREGLERLPEGMSVVRTCDRKGCVEHVGMFPSASSGPMFGKPMRKLTIAEVRWLRRQPRLYNLPSGKTRTEAREKIVTTLGRRMGWKSLQRLRSPSCTRYPEAW